MGELRLQSVTVRWGSGRRAVEAVRRLDLTVPSGSIVGLVGESGSGKSTLARAIVGLLPIAEGKISYRGAPVARRFRHGEVRPIQMVFQDPYSSLNPRMRVGESIAETIPRSVAAGRAHRRQEALRLLALVGMDAEKIDALPGELSGGQRQRVALARALAGRPDVLIADEVTSALDVSVQGTVLNLIRELQQEFGFSMVFISHNLAVVRYVSDLIAVMYRGEVVEFGPTQQLIDSPAHPYTAELLAAAPHGGAVAIGVTADGEAGQSNDNGEDT